MHVSYMALLNKVLFTSTYVELNCIHFQDVSDVKPLYVIPKISM